MTHRADTGTCYKGVNKVYYDFNSWFKGPDTLSIDDVVKCVDESCVYSRQDKWTTKHLKMLIDQYLTDQELAVCTKHKSDP